MAMSHEMICNFIAIVGKKSENLSRILLPFLLYFLLPHPSSVSQNT